MNINLADPDTVIHELADENVCLRVENDRYQAFVAAWDAWHAQPGMERYRALIEARAAIDAGATGEDG